MKSKNFAILAYEMMKAYLLVFKIKFQGPPSPCDRAVLERLPLDGVVFVPTSFVPHDPTLPLSANPPTTTAVSYQRT